MVDGYEQHQGMARDERATWGRAVLFFWGWGKKVRRSPRHCPTPCAKSGDSV